MKKQISKWMFRVSVTTLVITGLLVLIVLNPILTYANKTNHNNYTIFHSKSLDPNIERRLDQATQLIKTSELFDPNLKLNICLKDGSAYSNLVQALRGPAFGWGFYHEVVLSGNADFRNNYIELNGYKWNAAQLLAHEMIHCFQFNKLGLLKSSPVANIPNWKLEGYPEYIARQNIDQKILSKNIDKLVVTEKTDNNGWIQFADGTGTVISYYQYWLLIQYCIDIKRMTYEQILNDRTTEEQIRNQMMTWYHQNRKLNSK